MKKNYNHQYRKGRRAFGRAAGFLLLIFAIVFILQHDRIEKRYLERTDSTGIRLGTGQEQSAALTATAPGHIPEYSGAFDLCVSRAVASMSTLSEYCLPFVVKGGTFIAYKGPGSDAEISSAKNAVSLLGGYIDRVEETADSSFAVSGNEGHRLVYIQKINNTPEKYPRGGGKPSKKPL